MSKRRKRIRNGYLVAACIFGTAALLGLGWIAMLAFGLGPDDPLNWFQFLIIAAVMITGFVFGMGVGGWAWAIVGRLLFGLTRAEVASLLFDNQPVIPWMARYNRWGLRVLFGPGHSFGQESGTED